MRATFLALVFFHNNVGLNEYEPSLRASIHACKSILCLSCVWVHLFFGLCPYNQGKVLADPLACLVLFCLLCFDPNVRT